MGNDPLFFLSVDYGDKKPRLLRYFIMPKWEIQELESWIKPLVEEMGLELVDLEAAREPKGFILRLYIDRQPEGVTISDCEKVNSEINFRLDTIEEYKRYNISRLEVSSPGLDRKLKSDKDYQRYLGRKIRVILKSEVLRSQKLGAQDQSVRSEQIGKQNTFSGILKSYVNGKILLEEQKSNQTIEINIADIAVANLEVDWRQLLKGKKN